MTQRQINNISILSTALLGLFFLSWWLFANPVRDFAPKLPGMDNRPPGTADSGEIVEIGSLFQDYAGIAANIPGNWPRFRGADFDNINKETIPLVDSWGESGPEILWTIELGEGHAGPVVSQGRVFIMDYDEEERADILRCFSLQDGQEIWRRGYKLFIKRNHGMSRTVPAVTENYVVTMGPKCHVMCVAAATGELLWGVDLVKEYGTEVPLWYTGQCPLVDQNTVVVAAGGEYLLLGLDIKTGEIKWTTPNPHNWQMSHSSILPFSIHEEKTYVYCAIGGIAGVSAAPESAGEILFATSLWNHNVIAPSPIYLGDGRLFVTAGYGAGSMMLELIKSENAWQVAALQTIKPGEGVASEQQTPIYHQGHIFSIFPKDAGPLRNQLVCCHPDDLRKIVWSSGKTRRFGLGPYLVADDKLFVMSDDGVLTMLAFDTARYLQLAQAKVLNGNDAWGPMALANGRLLARDSRRLICLLFLLRHNP